MAYIKIVQKGFEKLTGKIGVHDFVDGKSVDDLPESECRRIGAAMRVVDAETDLPLGEGQHMLGTRNIRAGIPTAREKYVAPEPEVVVPTATLEPTLEFDYDIDSMAEIVDASGIKGLREFAKPFGVKGKTISELMASMMAAKKKAK